MRQERALKKITSVILILTSVLTLSSSVKPQSNLEKLTRMSFTARVDFECTTRQFPKQRLAKVLREAMKEFEPDTDVNGNRAVGFDLNKDGKLEYLIPLDCGVSNCMWGIFSADPPRLLGKMAAEKIYIERVAGWPVLVTYVHSSSVDGIISVYKYSKSGGYSKFGEDSEVNADRKEIPASMQATRSICGKSNASPARQKAGTTRSSAHE